MPSEPRLTISLRLMGQLVVVVGGGPVGLRKAKSALAVGAEVRLICLEPAPTEWRRPQLHWLQTFYNSAHLHGAVLVFAAANAAINEQVVRDAQAAGLWVNDAAEPDRGDFVLPATGHKGRISLSVSTDGAAPAAAVVLRDQLLLSLDDPTETWIEMLAQIRVRIREQIADPVRRRSLLEEMSNRRWIDRIRDVGAAQVQSEWEALLMAASRD